VLVEDRSERPGLPAEHGIALLLEVDGEKWLFDTGQSGLVVDNAHKLAIDLGAIKGIILSHGHYDHTGGLKKILQETAEVDIYAHPGIFRERYRLAGNGKTTPIGLPVSRNALEELGGRFNLTTTGREISPGIYLSGEIPRRTSFERGDPFLVIKEKGRYLPDPFIDDLFLMIETDEGLIMINGCCHAGLINSLKHLRSLRPRGEIRAIIGGLHLHSASDQVIRQTIDALHEFSPEAIIAGHCTGERAEAAFSRAFGSLFRKMKTGAVINLP